MHPKGMRPSDVDQSRAVEWQSQDNFVNPVNGRRYHSSVDRDAQILWPGDPMYKGYTGPLGPAHGKRPQTRRAACASRISGCSSSTPWCGCSPLPRAIPDGLGAARGPFPAIGTTRTTASSASEPAVVERALGPTTMSAVRVAVAELTRRASMKPDPRHLCHLQCWRRQRRRRCNGCPIEKTQIPACHSRLPNAALSRRSATACGARFSLSSSEARQRNLRGPL